LIIEGGEMATFDQREQNVIYQYNANGNINFGIVQNEADVAAELYKLQEEVKKAVQSGVLEEEVAVDVNFAIEKAAIQTKKPDPDKNSAMDYLNKAKTLIEGFTGLAGLVNGLTQATEMIKRLF
jgi:hypothetical protein